MEKSKIQRERALRKENFMRDYKRLMSEPNAVQLDVFRTLALIYGYSDFNSARTTYHRWNKELEDGLITID